jgi:hypothetical protein
VVVRVDAPRVAVSHSYLNGGNDSINRGIGDRGHQLRQHRYHPVPHGLRRRDGRVLVCKKSCDRPSFYVRTWVSANDQCLAPRSMLPSTVLTKLMAPDFSTLLLRRSTCQADAQANMNDGWSHRIDMSSTWGLTRSRKRVRRCRAMSLNKWPYV